MYELVGRRGILSGRVRVGLLERTCSFLSAQRKWIEVYCFATMRAVGRTDCVVW